MKDDRPTTPPPPLERPEWMPLHTWWLIEPELQRWKSAEEKGRRE